MSVIVTKIVGMIETNCYLVPVSNRLYIIDPGAEPDSILNAVKSFNLLDLFILLTHAHVDHIGGVGMLVKQLGIKQVYLHPADLGLYKSPDNHLRPFISPAKDLPVPVHVVDQQDFDVIETPGHTTGGVSFLFHHLPALFSGDTIFAGSVGRTDLPGGNYDILMSSIKGKILMLPDELKIYPGHGVPTTVASERENNPYLK